MAVVPTTESAELENGQGPTNLEQPPPRARVQVWLPREELAAPENFRLGQGIARRSVAGRTLLHFGLLVSRGLEAPF